MESMTRRGLSFEATAQIHGVESIVCSPRLLPQSSKRTMKPTAMTPVDEGARTKEALMELQLDDLFPHLDGLVPGVLSIKQIIREGYRILSQHFKLFLVPIILSLSAIPGSVISILMFSTQIEMPSAVLNGSLDSALKNPPSPDAWVWVVVEYIAFMVLEMCAEVAFDRAVVAAYLQERYSKATSGQDGIRSFVVGVLRCFWSGFAYSIALLVASLVACLLVVAVAGVGVLFLPNIVVYLLLVFITMGFFWLMLIWSLNVISMALPASALTKTSGFQALKRSALLIRGRIKFCCGLYLTFALFSLVIVLPAVVAKALQPQTVSAAFVLAAAVAIVGCWIINVLWAPCRTILYLKLRAWPGADDSFEVLLDQ